MDPKLLTDADLLSKIVFLQREFRVGSGSEIMGSTDLRIQLCNKRLHSRNIQKELPTFYLKFFFVKAKLYYFRS
jgi:hypothetical protein